MAKKLRSLLRGAARVHLPSSEPGRALCRARGTQDPARDHVTCRRCIKLAEINAGKRKGCRPKKFGQKFRQQLLLGGERRNGSTFADTSREHRRELEERARSYATAWLADPSLRPQSATRQEWREVCENELARRQPRTNPVTPRGPAFFDEPGFYPSSPVGLTQRALHKAVERIDRAPDHAALHRAHRAALDLYRKRGDRALGRDAGTLFNDINFSYNARYRELGPTEEDLHTERMRAARAAEKAGRPGRGARRNGRTEARNADLIQREHIPHRYLGRVMIVRGKHIVSDNLAEYEAEEIKSALHHAGYDVVLGHNTTAGKGGTYGHVITVLAAPPRRNGSPRNVVHGLERARYIQQDAHEALLSAAAKRDMRGVQKYADQIARAQDAEQELERAMSYVGKAQRKRHITGSWRTEDRLKDVGLAEWRQKLAGQSVGRALAKLRPNGRGHDPAAREQAIGQLRALGMPRDEAVANLDGAVADGSSYGAVVRWARRHYSAARDNAMGGAFGPAD